MLWNPRLKQKGKERSTGFEPATGDLRRTCSIQLSYERMERLAARANEPPSSKLAQVNFFMSHLPAVFIGAVEG